MILQVKSKEDLILSPFNLITRTDRSSNSIGVDKEHSWQRIFNVYKEIQYRFEMCHVDNQNFLKKRRRRMYYISNQAIYRKEREGSIRPTIDFI